MFDYFKSPLVLIIMVSNIYAYNILDNGNLLFGNAQYNTSLPTYTPREDSVNSKGTLQQPYYWNKTYTNGDTNTTGAWKQLTYYNYALDNVIAVGGDGTNDWNRNGVSVSNPVLANQVIDYSGFTKYDSDRGTGTIISTGVVTIDGYELEVTNRYELPEGKSYIVMTTTVKNVDANQRTVTNLRFWTGTRDDYIDGHDANSKSRGNFIDGVYTQVTNASDQAKVVKIFNNSAGIYFYSTTDKADSIIATHYGLDTLLATAPSDQAEIATDDGSYAIYMRLNDLAYGESEKFTVYYAAGAIEDLDAIALDVSNAAIVGKRVNEDSSAVFAANDFEDSNNTIYSKIQIKALPANGILKLNGVSVTLNQEINSSDYVNMTYTPNPNYFGNDNLTWQGIGADGSRSADSVAQLIIAGINDTPTIDTTFNDITINEDNGTTTYELNVSDIEGSDLNITVESNNTNILTVTPNWTNLVNQATWTDTLNPLDFNLTTVANANGVVRITIHVDDSELNAIKTFDVNVTAVDDAPTLDALSNVTTLEDGTDSNITLTSNDVDGNPITYTVSSSNPSIATVAIVNGHLIVTQVANGNGIATIEVNATANGLTATQDFNLSVTAVNDAPTIASIGSVSKNEDFADFNVTIQPTDRDADNLKLSIDMNDTGIISIPSNSTDWIPNGYYTQGLSLPIHSKANKFGTTELNVTVKDPSGATYTTSFQVTVLPVDDAPVATNMAATVGPDSQSLFNSFRPTFSDVDGDNPVALKIESLPTVGTFESDTNGDGTWSEITSVPFEVPMSDLAKYRFNAGNNAGSSTDVNWSIMTSSDNTYTSGLWSNTTTGVVTIIDSANNNAPDVNITLNNADINGTVQTINEDENLSNVYITFSDDYTPSKFLVGVLDSNDSSKVSLADGDFIYHRISDNNISITIKPKANVYGDVNITLGAFDGDKNGTRTFTLHINSVNDIPTAMNFEKTINEDTNYSFSSLDPKTIYLDTNDSSQDSSKVYPTIFQILTLPQQGRLHLGDGVALSADENVSISSLSSLVYTPALNNHTDVTFNWRAYDGEAWTQTKTATIHINPVDDAPTLDALPNVTTLEDGTDSNITLNANDVEGNPITYTVSSSNPSIATVAIVNGHLIVTQVANGNGVATIEVNATANGLTATQDFDMNVTAVDDAPTFTSQQGSYGVNEDSSAYSVILTASDLENNSFTYHASASNDKVTLSLVDNNLTITPNANANGTTTIDVNVTQDSNTTLYDAYSFDVTINPVNDTPTIDTTFNDITINEDNGTTTYELNVSDIEGSDLNITVESNNTNILTVTPNWTNLVNQATWTDTLNPLDFNLTTVANANGVVRITIHVDDSELNAIKTFDVNVTAVDDAPTLDALSNVTTLEDGTDSNITLTSNDVDGNPITYTVSSSNPSIATVAIVNGHLIVTQVANGNGVATIEVNATANGLTATRDFDMNVTAVDDAPVLTAITNPSTKLEDFQEFTLDLTAIDVDGDAYRFSVVSNTPTIATATIDTNNTLHISSIANSFGNANFTIKVTQDSNSSLYDTQSITFNVLGVNDIPTITDISDLNKSEDSPDSNVSFRVADVDKDNLNITVINNATNLLSTTLVGSSTRTYSEYNNKDINLILASVANRFGQANITVNVKDANNTLASSNFLVNIPAVLDFPNISTEAISLNEDFNEFNITLTNIDHTNAGSVDINITLSNAIVTLPISTVTTTDNNYTFALNSIANISGDANLTIAITSGGQLVSKTIPLTITPVNDAPVISGTALRASENTPYSWTPTLNDIDSNSFTFSATPLPSWAQINSRTGEITGTPTYNDAGNYSDINITVNDGLDTASLLVDIDVRQIDRTPIIPVLSAITKAEDFSTFSFNLNASDPDGDQITYTLSLSDPTLLNATIGTTGEVTITSLPNKNGVTTIEVNATANGLTATRNFDMNVTAVDDAPTLDALPNITTLEDGTDSNITLTANDVDGNPITYTVSSSNPSIATVEIVNGHLIVTQVANGNGVATIEVNATANGLTATQDFNMNVRAVNDAPNIDTNFNDITINEDKPSFSVDMNVSDIDGDELNVTVKSNNTNILTVKSNNTNILTVTPNWSGLLNEADYSQPLDFNITTVADKNGDAVITVTVDDGTTTTSKTFTLNVAPVNDAPVLYKLADRIYYKNFTDKDINLTASDIDDTNLTYSVSVGTSDIIDSASVIGNVLTLKSLSGAYGDTNITVSVKDDHGQNSLSDSKTFTLQVLSFESGGVTEEASPTDVNETNTSTTYSNIIGQSGPSSSEIVITRVEDNNGSVTHEIAVGGKVVKATSDLNGSVVATTSDGVQTTYADANVSVKVDATVTGQATHRLTVNGITTEATSDVIGAHTQITRDANNSIEIITTVDNNDSNISVTAKADGTAEHKVVQAGKTTTVTSTVSGAKTVITANNVETSVDTNTTGGTFFRAVAKTKSNGTTVTSFEKVDNNGTVLDTFDTFMPATPYDAGNEVEIFDVNGTMFIRTIAPLSNTRLIVE